MVNVFLMSDVEFMKRTGAYSKYLHQLYFCEVHFNSLSSHPLLSLSTHLCATPRFMASAVVLVLVFAVDLIAFALAIAAEQRRSTARVVPDSEKNYTYCVYDSDIATGYGVGSLLFLMAGQAIATVGSKCFCCGRALRPGGPRACALLLFLFSWLTFVIAESCLLAGSVENAYHTKYRTLFVDNPPSCQTLRKGVFGAGAAFVFFTAVLTELYYVCFSKARDATLAKEPSIGLSSYS
ncbi:hypothetical protein HPP92_002965 [Vanilla planifolia]|uniref:Fiber protein Fb34 n=1 Tax=Vanilla planifolia TaxID=51239 RepID=A0A835SFQ6_VANPL|nr:hypothetical protein HPP92_003344 [Vanilla planifolia]KAG0502893.1 hypothetical protein HPP92_002965 [Vanilla planifolia]